MPHCRISPRWIYGLTLVGFLNASPLQAQQIQWRGDYDTARREAKEKNLPLVIDFGTANCTWCQKLDASTFRDAAIVKQMNEQFIPVKIDADRSRGLTNALEINSFPTVVFAAPDGKILGVQEGFVDAAKFNQQLRRAQADSFAQAPAPVAHIVGPTAQQASPSAPSIRLTVHPLETAAVSGDRARQARELLAMAQADLSSEQYLSCLDHCQMLAAAFADLPEAAAAQQLAVKIKSDPELTRKMSDKLAGQLGELYMSLAESALDKNQAQLAAAYLQRVLEACPGTPSCLAAQQRLNQIQSGLPIVRAQSK